MVPVVATFWATAPGPVSPPACQAEPSPGLKHQAFEKQATKFNRDVLWGSEFVFCTGASGCTIMMILLYHRPGDLEMQLHMCRRWALVKC
jgi:hypothetical protein